MPQAVQIPISDSLLKTPALRRSASSLKNGNDSNAVMTVQQEKKDPPAFRFSDADTTIQPFNYLLKDQTSGSESLFTNHLLQPINSTPVPVASRNPDWFAIVLLIVIAGFTWIRVFYFKILKQLIAAFFNNNVSNQVVRDENILVQRASILLSFIFYLTASLFAYQLTIFFGWSHPVLGQGFPRFLIISLLIAFTYSFKMVLLKGLGELFRVDKAVATYIFNIFLINNIMGLVLIPVVVLSAYMISGNPAVVIYTGIALVIISFIYRLLRGFTIWAAMPGVSFFYLFLYFCTLEIAPLLLIIKVAQG